MGWNDLWVALLLVLTVTGARPAWKNNGINEEYLSFKTGRALKGLFSIVVMLHHLAQRADGGLLFSYFAQVGHFAVSVYFFLSGYGLQKSHNASDHYREKFLQKRLMKIFLPYIAATLLFWIVRTMNGASYTVGDFFAAILMIDPVVKFSWYIVCICCFYVAYWAFMHLCKQNNRRMILCTCLWFAAYTVFCIHTNRGAWWYNTPHVLIMGVIWACYEEKILSVIKKRYAGVFSLAAVAFAAAFLARHIVHTQLGSLLQTMLVSVLFVLLVILLLLKVNLTSRILEFLGGFSLELYLIHGLWVVALRSNILYMQNDVLWPLAVIPLSVVSAWILHQALKGFYRWTARLGKEKAK